MNRMRQGNCCQKIKEKKYMVNILVNNAGFGLVGGEKDLKLEQEEKMPAVNITALTQLCHLFLKDMSYQKEGKILNVASTGAVQGPDRIQRHILQANRM